jgi:hypothetical protein
MTHRHIISVLALLVILSGVAYAHRCESLRDSLDSRFDHINAVYFDGQLSDVQVRWGFLSDGDYGVANDDGTIIIDPWNVGVDERQLDETLKHEACHMWVGVEHQHGLKWQQCMTRFENQ